MTLQSRAKPAALLHHEARTHPLAPFRPPCHLAARPRWLRRQVDDRSAFTGRSRRRPRPLRHGMCASPKGRCHKRRHVVRLTPARESLRAPWVARACSGFAPPRAYRHSVQSCSSIQNKQGRRSMIGKQTGVMTMPWLPTASACASPSRCSAASSAAAADGQVRSHCGRSGSRGT
jgi:hypothetical protein